MSLKDSKYGSKEQSLIKSDSKVSYVIIGGQSNIMQSNLAIRKIVSKISWTNNNNLSFTEILCHPRIHFIETSLQFNNFLTLSGLSDRYYWTFVLLLPV